MKMIIIRFITDKMMLLVTESLNSLSIILNHIRLYNIKQSFKVEERQFTYHHQRMEMLPFLELLNNLHKLTISMISRVLNKSMVSNSKLIKD